MGQGSFWPEFELLRESERIYIHSLLSPLSPMVLFHPMSMVVNTSVLEYRCHVDWSHPINCFPSGFPSGLLNSISNMAGASLKFFSNSVPLWRSHSESKTPCDFSSLQQPWTFLEAGATGPSLFLPEASDSCEIISLGSWLCPEGLAVCQDLCSPALKRIEVQSWLGIDG